MIGSLPRQEVEATIARVLAFDQEPVSADVLLKAVRFVAQRFGDEIEEIDERAQKGLLRFRSGRWDYLTTVKIEDGLVYHCWGFDIKQGDTRQWVAKTTSELVWKICGNPNIFVATPKVAK